MVVAVGRFSEASPHGTDLLASYHGRPLRVPQDETLRPDPIHPAWHRRERFKTE